MATGRARMAARAMRKEFMMGGRVDWDRGDEMSSMRSWHESLPKQSEQIRLAGNSGSRSHERSRDFKYAGERAATTSL